LIGRFCALREDVLSFALSAYVAELMEVHLTRNFTTKIIFNEKEGFFSKFSQNSTRNWAGDWLPFRVIIDVALRPSQLARLGGHTAPRFRKYSLHDRHQPVKSPHSSISQFA
jgi:hypothetical protein